MQVSCHTVERTYVPFITRWQAGITEAVLAEITEAVVAEITEAPRVRGFRVCVAPRVGLEPTTLRLTAGCSAD